MEVTWESHGLQMRKWSPMGTVNCHESSMRNKKLSVIGQLLQGATQCVLTEEHNERGADEPMNRDRVPDLFVVVVLLPSEETDEGME